MTGIHTRQVALLVANGVHHASLSALQKALTAEGAVVHFVGPRVGNFTTVDGGGVIEANKSLENSPSVLFDAIVLPDGVDAVQTLVKDGHTMEFLKDAFRHCKSILSLGASDALLDKAGLLEFTNKDPGMLWCESAGVDGVIPAFVAAIAAHRHPARDTDPPVI